MNSCSFVPVPVPTCKAELETQSLLSRDSHIVTRAYRSTKSTEISHIQDFYIKKQESVSNLEKMIFFLNNNIRLEKRHKLYSKKFQNSYF